MAWFCVCESLRALTLSHTTGDATAAFITGRLHSKGEGVPQSYAKARHYYKVAADNGESDAQYNLAVLYEKGRGMPADIVQAAKLYHAAAAGGHSLAQQALDEVLETHDLPEDVFD